MTPRVNDALAMLASSPSVSPLSPLYGPIAEAVTENSQPRRSRSAPPRHTVRFLPKVKVVEIRPLSKMTKEELSNVYYSGADYNASLSEIRSTTLAMRRGKSLDLSCQTDRGIEHLRTAQKLQHFQDAQERHIVYVLRAHKSGATPQEIANLSSKLSTKSSRVALRRAMKDVAEAAEIRDEECAEFNLMTALTTKTQRQLSVEHGGTTNGDDTIPKNL